MKVFSAEQFYQADSISTEKQNISALDLMERAGEKIFQWLEQRLKGAQIPIHIFCGIGNNGGDGLVVGRLLIENGHNVNVYVANFTDNRSKCFLINYDRIKSVSKNWPLLMSSEEDFPMILEEDIIIDALFGIGLNRPLTGWVKKLVIYLNGQKAFKLAIDIPSGMFANKALTDLEAVINANHTLTFQAPKLSFFLPETGVFVSFFEVIDIGLDQEYLESIEPLARIVDKQVARTYYKPRTRYTHKGNFGHAMIVGGSYGKIGATVLAATAVMRIGAGLVSIFAPSCGYEIIQTSLPEAMTISDENDKIITQIKHNIDPAAIGIGMGMGTNQKSVDALKELFATTKAPLVIDADGINALAKDKELLKLLPPNSILTPHPGELKRLIGIWKDDFDKLDKVKRFSKKHKVIVVIKGANTITVFDNKLYINATGNQGMATAGSGDVLTGAITGLLSQGYDHLYAALFGVYLHGSAGDLASEINGYDSMMASDILSNFGEAYLKLLEPEEPSTADVTDET